MAVYTKLTKNDVNIILNDYNCDKLTSLTGITSGVSNTNYLIKTASKKYILTIFEERTNTDSLPFFINLMNDLANKGINCPKVLKKNNGKYIINITKNQIKKKAILISFLDGKELIRPISNSSIYKVGQTLAKMHVLMRDSKLENIDNMWIDTWEKQFSSVKEKINILNPSLKKLLRKELNSYKKKDLSKLPKGIIHADLFIDNVFFDNNKKLSGIIDFYFACNGILIYDLAITLNAWCFSYENNDKEKSYMDIKKVNSLIDGYQEVRPLSKDEIQEFPYILKMASMRFLMSRLYDILNIKGINYNRYNPNFYIEKLKLHSKLSSKDYGFK